MGITDLRSEVILAPAPQLDANHLRLRSQTHVLNLVVNAICNNVSFGN